MSSKTTTTTTTKSKSKEDLFKERFQFYVNQGLDPSGAAAKTIAEMKRLDSVFRVMTEKEFELINKLMWPRSVVKEDMLRWHRQGFVWSEYINRKFGLIQNVGGPCGVLAAVQAYLLRFLLFGSKSMDSKKQWTRIQDDISAEERECALASAMSDIVSQCRARETSKFVLVRLANSNEILTPESKANRIVLAEFDDIDSYRLALRRNMASFFSKSGVLLFVYSVVLSRGIEFVRSDTDEPGMCALTAKHGHCTQELLNLLLLGVARSQVFDGTRPVGETGLVLRGVEKRPQVGLLSYLEAMRYLEVGSLFKNPLMPIYVISSSSHFTVLFCLERDLVAQSTEERVYKSIRRAFATFDSHDNGFINVSDLDKLLDATSKLGANSEDSQDEDPVTSFVSALSAQRAKLRSVADPDNMGIILWKNFWLSCNQIVAESQRSSSSSSDAASMKEWESTCRSAFDSLDVHRNAFISVEELKNLLKKLPPPVQTMDAAVAKLECDVDGLGIILWSNFWSFASQHRPSASSLVAAKTADSVASGRTFSLFHYNGLQRIIQGQDCGPCLTPFKLHVIPPGQIGGALPPKSSKLLQVLRTRFKGARVDWGECKPSSIDG